MEPVAQTLLILGSLLIAGMAVNVVAGWIHLPRVTLLLLFGLAIGPAGLGWLAGFADRWFPLVTHISLVMVGFLLGSELKLEALRRHGRAVLVISFVVVAVTLLCLTPALVPWVSLPIALVLAALATATDPAASMDVIKESKARGPLTQILRGVVAVDDGWALIAFSIALAVAQMIAGAGDASSALVAGLWEVGGAIALGFALGVPMASLSGRIAPGEPSLAEALGFVLICGGSAKLLGVSYLLAAVTMGVTVANIARHHSRAFRSIDGVDWPFMILFFVLAGASLELDALVHAGPLLAAYVVLRIVTRLLGGFVGARAAGCEPGVQRWIGVALLPQAGVALGMALVAAERLPGFAESALPVVIAATVLFELLGPPLTRLALKRAGELAP